MAKTRESISVAMRFHIMRRDKFTCQYCGAKAPDAALHVEHIKPVIEGGTNDHDNLCAACVRCNLGKGVMSAQTDDERPMTERERQLSHYKKFWITDTRRAHWASEVYVGGSSHLRLLLLYFARHADPFGAVCELDIKQTLKDVGIAPKSLAALVHGLVVVGYLGYPRVDDDYCTTVSFDLAPIDSGERPPEHLMRPSMAWFGKFSDFSPVEDIYG